MVIETTGKAGTTIKPDGKAEIGQGFTVWQRGSNENMNGLVRQYLPKGTDLSGYTQQQLDAIADEINARPRKGLGVRCPLAVYRELLLNSTQQSNLVH